MSETIDLPTRAQKRQAEREKLTAQKLLTYGEAQALINQTLFDFTRLVLDGRYVLNPDRPQAPHSDKPD